MSIKVYKYGKAQVNINESAIAEYQVLENNKDNKFYARNLKKYMVLLYLIGDNAPYIYVGIDKGFDYYQEAERTMTCIMEGEGENSDKWIEFELKSFLEEYEHGNLKKIRVHYLDLIYCTLVVDDENKKYRIRVYVDGFGNLTFKKYSEDREQAIKDVKETFHLKYDGRVINDKEEEKKRKLEEKLDYVEFDVFKEDKYEKGGFAFETLKPFDIKTYGFRFINFYGYEIVFNGSWRWKQHSFKTEEEAEKKLKKIFKEKFDELEKIEIDNTKELEKSKEMTKKIQGVSSKMLPILSIIFGVVGIGLVVLGHLTNDENFRFVSVLPALVATLLLEILLSFKIKIKIPKVVYVVLSIVVLIVVMILWWQVICGINVF